MVVSAVPRSSSATMRQPLGMAASMRVRSAARACPGSLDDAGLGLDGFELDLELKRKALGVVVPRRLRPVGHALTDSNNQQTHSRASGFAHSRFFGWRLLCCRFFGRRLDRCIHHQGFDPGFDHRRLHPPLLAWAVAAVLAAAFLAAAASDAAVLAICALGREGLLHALLGGTGAPQTRRRLGGFFGSRLGLGRLGSAVTTGLAAPNFRRTGFSPQNSSRL